MFNPIKAVLRIPHYFNILTYIIYIVALVNNVRKDSGVVYLNYALIAAAVIFLIAYIVLSRGGKEEKKKIKSVKRYHKWFKLGMKGLSLFIVVYSFVSAASSDNMSMVMPSILVFFWLIQVSLEISKYRARKRRERRKAKWNEFKSKFKKNSPETEDDSIPEYDLDLEMTLAKGDNIRLHD